MSFFKSLFGGNNNSGNNSSSVKKQEVVIEKPSQEKLNVINLRKETFRICLEKNNLKDLVARVAVVLDYSVSMKPVYYSGDVQEIVERLLPAALKLDDNGEMEVWLFDHAFKRVDSITIDDFTGYATRIVNANKNWGGTNYSPVINDIVKKYTVEEPSNIPTYVLFITDGENSDPRESERAIREASKHNIFWQFIGIGSSSFDFLEKLDTMEGRIVDNANFFDVTDLTEMDEKDLYNRLLEEYPSWERDARAKGILK